MLALNAEHNALCFICKDRCTDFIATLRDILCNSTSLCLLMKHQDSPSADQNTCSRPFGRATLPRVLVNLSLADLRFAGDTSHTTRSEIQKQKRRIDNEDRLILGTAVISQPVNVVLLKSPLTMHGMYGVVLY